MEVREALVNLGTCGTSILQNTIIKFILGADADAAKSDENSALNNYGYRHHNDEN